jgi:hypothetical protein
MGAGALVSAEYRCRLEVNSDSYNGASPRTNSLLLTASHRSTVIPTAILTACFEISLLKRLLDETRTERGPGYAAAQFIFLDTLSTMNLYVDEGRNRSIPADQPSDLLDPSNMEQLDQPMFLLGHGVENQVDGIQGDEEYLYVVEIPSQKPIDEPAEWTVKVSDHSGFPRW